MPAPSVSGLQGSYRVPGTGDLQHCERKVMRLLAGRGCAVSPCPFFQLVAVSPVLVDLQQLLHVDNGIDSRARTLTLSLSLSLSLKSAREQTTDEQSVRFLHCAASGQTLREPIVTCDIAFIGMKSGSLSFLPSTTSGEDNLQIPPGYAKACSMHSSGPDIDPDEGTSTLCLL